MNELPTSSRRRFLNGNCVRDCAFCSHARGDAIEHWELCPVLVRCAQDLFGDEEAVRIFGCFFMRAPSGPEHLKRFCAFIHGVWRCRNAIVHGTQFSSYEDLCRHMRMIVEDPWLHALVPDLDRKGRRAHRVAAPEPRPEAYVYNSDGASRKREDERKGSFGAVLQRNGQQLARIGVYLGDVTNNVAEYEGVAEAMRHALGLAGHGSLHIWLRVDSMLVKQQVLCEIA